MEYSPLEKCPQEECPPESCSQEDSSTEKRLPLPGIIAPGNFFSQTATCITPTTYKDKVHGVFYGVYN